MLEEIRKRMTELKAESASLDEQFKQGQQSMAQIQRQLAQIDERRYAVVGAYRELEKLVGEGDGKETPGNKEEDPRQDAAPALEK